MKKDRQKQRAAKGTAAIGDQTGKGDCPICVVGIGAPAGGLKSLSQLFAKMPPGYGVAFVLIPHPEPSGETLTAKRLGDMKALSVVEAEDGMPVLPDRIHVMPPISSSTLPGGDLPFTNRCSAMAYGCPLTTSSVPWPSTRNGGAAAFCSPAPEATGL